MSEPTNDECWHTLNRVYEFLDHELDDASGDQIREHLAACEPSSSSSTSSRRSTRWSRVVVAATSHPIICAPR